MPEVKPVKYKKMFRDALVMTNEKMGLNIPESEIGALARKTYHGGQTRIEPLDGKEYHVVNIPVVEEYHKQLAVIREQAQNRWDLKVLAVINERTGRNLPSEAAEKIRRGGGFPGCENWDDQMRMYYLYKKVSEELENAGKMTKEARLLAQGMKVCGRCGGSGRYSYNQRDLDRCYGCGGSGAVPIKKKGKGWKEAGQMTASGNIKAPEHVRAATKKATKGIMKNPMYRKDFTLQDAKRIGNIVGVDWTKTPEKEYKVGLNMELGEHGRRGGDITNITNDDEITIGKIALAHITEFPNYYNDKTGLPAMERRLKT